MAMTSTGARRRTRWAAAAGAALVTITGAGACTANPPTDGWRTEMLASINRERAAQGLRPMDLCSSLNRAAQSYAEDLAKRGVLSHTGADGSTPAARERAAGYLPAKGTRYIHGGENIAMGYPSVSAVMTGWMGSAGHRRNLLDASTNHVGLGRQGNWWVQNFGSGGRC